MVNRDYRRWRMRTHLGGNEPEGEYIGLLGEIAVLKKLWRYP